MCMIRRNNNCQEKSCRSANLSTTQSQMDPGSNPGHCGEKPANNHLTYGTVFTVHKDTHQGTFLKSYSDIPPPPENPWQACPNFRLGDDATYQSTR
jgi:hypothetical protein